MGAITVIGLLAALYGVCKIFKGNWGAALRDLHSHKADETPRNMVKNTRRQRAPRRGEFRWK